MRIVTQRSVNYGSLTRVTAVTMILAVSMLGEKISQKQDSQNFMNGAVC